MKTPVITTGKRGAWIPPDGLDRCRPRQIHLTAAGHFVLALAISFMAGGVAAGTGLGLVASRQAAEARLLHREDTVTDGQVTRLWRAGDDNRQAWISYKFSAQGRVYGRRARISRPSWSSLRLGSRIVVHYAFSRPDLSYPLDAASRPMPPAVPFVVALSLITSGLLVLLVLRRQTRLLAEGRAAPGMVTRLSKAQHSSGHGQNVYFDFLLLNGAPAHGKAGPMKKPPAVGSPVTIVYDPETPRRNALYPLCLVALADRRPLR